MENISQRLSSEDTDTSMYLSFDDKIEAISDISTMSVISRIEGRDDLVNNLEDKDMNSSLEAQGNFSLKIPLKTVKKVETMTTNTPLKAWPKNILKDCIALSSAPSKEQLLKFVNVTRGSDATRCTDLGLAFLGVDDETPAYFLPPFLEQYEENKENALPESKKGSTLSVFERKMLSSMSTLGSTTVEESIVAIKANKMVEEYLVAKKAIETTPKAKEMMVEGVMEMNDKVDYVKEFVEISLRAKIDRLGNMAVISEVLEETDELTPKVKEIEVTKKIVASKSSGKSKIAILASSNTRRTICEPNLPTTTKFTLMDAETEIPLLMNKMLKISNKNNTSYKNNTSQPRNDGIIMASMKTRTSLIPSATGDKRPRSVTQCMSVVIKTTLNSPARKIARKSTMGATMSSQQRRSFLPLKTNTEQSSKKSQNLLLTRKSMLPKTDIPMNNNCKTTIKTITSVKESTSTTTTQRKSTYPLTKVSEESKIKPLGGLACNKPDATFTCNVCKEKFRIKSLRDAHKRSHEKPIASATYSIGSRCSLLGGNTNQCKYCDKKFALVKALHIHLLQYCFKIPPTDKRKLQYTDLNHVEKAPLPNVFTRPHPYQCSNASSAVTSTSATPRNVLKRNGNSMTAPKSLLESLNANKDVQKSTTDSVTIERSNMMAPLCSSVKKNTAHAGVYRTPSKMVPCHLCKSTFKTILDYTNHSLTAHGSNKTHHNSDKGKS